MSWRGHYLDGRRADRRAATVWVSRLGLHITTDDGATHHWPFAEVRQTQGAYAGEPVRLERGGDVAESLIVEDLALLTALRAVAPTGRRFHDPRRRRRRGVLTLGAGLAAGSLAVALYWWGIPVMAGAATHLVPVAWEMRVGDEVFARVARPESRCVDPARQRMIDGIVARLTAARGTEPYRVRVTVVDWAEVNALALPGGNIVILRGLLDRTDTPEMLAGVLAHEVQHVLKRHTTRAIIQHASTGLLVAAVAGDVSGAVTFALEGARLVAALGYSRRAEEEADIEGLQMLLEAGIDPAGMVAFFERVLGRESEPEGGWRYLSTHPTTRGRVERLKGLGANGAPSTRPLLADHDWAEVKRICAGA
ncbi:MAG: M48 family metallopeptidase [Candidatus Rokuibacteriota bacterium]